MSLCCGVAVVGTAYIALQMRAMRADIDVRRLRMTEPLVTAWECGGYRTSVTTPRIESEEIGDRSQRHWDSVTIALYYEPDFLTGALHRHAADDDDVDEQHRTAQPDDLSGGR
jgi:hypothetical protein